MPSRIGPTLKRSTSRESPRKISSRGPATFETTTLNGAGCHEAARARDQRRSAPPTTPRTTSLTVTPCAVRTALTSARERLQVAKLRRIPSGPLNEVAGTSRIGRGGEASEPRRILTRAATLLTVRLTSAG